MSYDLYYWPNIQGRGEFVRLAFEATQTPYRDVAREEGVNAVVRMLQDGAIATPSFAPPILVDNHVTMFTERHQVIAQVAAILSHLGPRLGLAPHDEPGQVWVNQIQLTMTDFVAEIHDTHHPLGAGLYYEEQRQAAKQRSEHFLAVRMPKYFHWLETALARNSLGSGHLVGRTLSYVDLSLFQIVEGMSYAFPNAMAEFRNTWEGLGLICDHVRGLPNVATYLASPRRVPFSEAGVFRHYPELDA